MASSTFVTITKINETYLHIDADSGILAELSDRFKFRPPNYQFHPKFKARMWDGYIYLLDRYRQTLYAGLINELLKYCESSGYSVKISDNIEIKDEKIVTKEDVIDFIRGDFCVPEKFELRDYQIDAIAKAINASRAVLLSPTGSGKSFMQYVLIRFYEQILPEDQKLLVIVPTTSLVSQMISDFEDYSQTDPDWSAKDRCHPIMAGKDKHCKDKRIYVSTWQSLYKEPKAYFKQFGFINNDECHLAQATSLKKINEAAINCKYRFGTTGTLKESKTHELTIVGLLGPVISVATTKELIDKNILSNLEINSITLVHPQASKKFMVRKTYQEEVDFIENTKARTNFIASFGDHLDSNTLFLFSRRAHGKDIYKALQKTDKPDEIYYVDGTISAEEREDIRASLENPNKTVYVVGSYQTMATGINVKNLHNIVLCSSSKSMIRILQSIGRGLRTHSSKTKCRIFDISDDLKHGSWVNYSLQHSRDRELIYIKQKFQYTKKRIPL